MRIQGRWRATWALLGVVASVAGVRGAHAADAPAAVPTETAALAREVAQQLHAARHAEAAERLDEDACAALAAAPSAAYDVAAAVAQQQANALRTDPHAAAVLTERLASLAGPTDASPHAAGVRALHELLRALTGGLHERPATVDDVRKALAALRKLEARLPPTQPTYVALVKLAQLVATRVPTDADAWGAVLVVAEPLRAMDPPDESIVRAAASAALERGILLAPGDAAAARPLLEQGLERYARASWVRRKKDGSWPDGTALFNRALTAAKRIGGAAKVDYAHDVFKSRGERLKAKVPALLGWTWTYTEEEQDYGKLVRERPGVDKVEIQLWGYNGWTEYTFGDGSTVPGENLDGFLKRGMKMDRESLSSVTRETRTNEGINGVFKDTKGYETKGISIDGVPTRYRNWFFKDPFELKRFYNLALTQTGAYDEKDPELLFLLGSLEGRYAR